ncbi:hypothetical protein [Sporosarcina sp. PTS2304]|nr:hypothetical protein [Sporosarcina sp. PTS2304]
MTDVVLIPVIIGLVEAVKGYGFCGKVMRQTDRQESAHSADIVGNK